MTSRLKRAPRRTRAAYPSLTDLPRGKQCDLERKEAGRNVGLPTYDIHGIQQPGRVSVGTYVFEREMPRPSRNRYDPQVEDQKRGRRQ